MSDGLDIVSYLMGQRSVDPNAEYYTKAQTDVLLNQKQNNLQYATGTITTNATTVTVSYNGDFINAYALQGVNLVQCNIIINSNSVVFTLAKRPTAPVVCNVIYG